MISRLDLTAVDTLCENGETKCAVESGEKILKIEYLHAIGESPKCSKEVVNLLLPRSAAARRTYTHRHKLDGCDTSLLYNGFSSKLLFIYEYNSQFDAHTVYLSKFKASFAEFLRLADLSATDWSDSCHRADLSQLNSPKICAFS
ncbi:hypothetical protein Syun_019436 [Stephania yunnanensis]|uniref:Uncharacterized protein n=1 Tax=Stephania yunnanensis TaxID=152371 RepID=A0AAP0IU93_9MAGN